MKLGDQVEIVNDKNKIFNGEKGTLVLRLRDTEQYWITFDSGRICYHWWHKDQLKVTKEKNAPINKDV